MGVGLGGRAGQAATSGRPRHYRPLLRPRVSRLTGVWIVYVAPRGCGPEGGLSFGRFDSEPSRHDEQPIEFDVRSFYPPVGAVGSG